MEILLGFFFYLFNNLIEFKYLNLFITTIIQDHHQNNQDHHYLNHFYMLLFHSTLIFNLDFYFFISLDCNQENRYRYRIHYPTL